MQKCHEALHDIVHVSGKGVDSVTVRETDRVIALGAAEIGTRVAVEVLALKSDSRNDRRHHTPEAEPSLRNTLNSI